MIVYATAGQYVGIAIAVLGGIALHIWAGVLCYRYFTKYFPNMPQWVAFVLSLGGLATYIGFVVLDEFMHRSMMGENSRAWKNDPERGEYIVPWSEVDKLKRVCPVDWQEYRQLMDMVYNLHHSQKRLARRAIRLKQELDKADPATREYVLDHAVEVLRGKINTDLVWMQTHQHPDSAERGAIALTRMFGDRLGPLDPDEDDAPDF